MLQIDDSLKSYFTIHFYSQVPHFEEISTHFILSSCLFFLLSIVPASTQPQLLWYKIFRNMLASLRHMHNTPTHSTKKKIRKEKKFTRIWFLMMEYTMTPYYYWRANVIETTNNLLSYTQITVIAWIGSHSIDKLEIYYMERSEEIVEQKSTPRVPSPQKVHRVKQQLISLFTVLFVYCLLISLILEFFLRCCYRLSCVNGLWVVTLWLWLRLRPVTVTVTVTRSTFWRLLSSAYFLFAFN